jgi:ubiquinone biosynthesis protein COQ9
MILPANQQARLSGNKVIDSTIDLRIVQQKLILQQVLELTAFEGLSDATITKAAVEVGLHHMAGKRLFAGGVNDLLAFYNTQLNEELEALAEVQNLAQMRTHERIEWLLLKRFEQLQPYKEAVRRITAYSALPWNANAALKRLWQSCDVIWRLAGDKSLDYNYYSKRSLLAKVYVATLLFWLNDQDDNLQEFVQRQIAGVLNMGRKMGMANAKISNLVENAADRVLHPKRYRTKKF